MNSLSRFTLVCCATVLAAGKTLAADSEPVLGLPGKLLFEDDFSRADLKPKWQTGKGFWTLNEGVVTAAENPADSHAAYITALPHFPYKDIVAEFSFKLDGSKSCTLMIKDGSYKGSHAGHILRASVLPGKVQLADSKFGGMKLDIFEKLKDPKTTPEERKQLAASVKDKTVSFKIALDLAQWHQARVEVVGDEMIISIDGKVAGYLKSEGVDHPTKNMFGFNVAGKSAQLDNIKVWDASAAPGWAARRVEVAGALQKLP